MKKHVIRNSLAGAVALMAVGVGVTYWKSIALEWHMWHLKNETEGGALIAHEEKIRALAPFVLERLEKYMFSSNSTSLQRRAAAFGIAASEKQIACAIFTRGLRAHFEPVIIESIYGLGLIGEKSVFREVMQYGSSKNEQMRIAVAGYFFHVPNVEAKPLLKSMLSDQNDFVVTLARDALEKI